MTHRVLTCIIVLILYSCNQVPKDESALNGGKHLFNSSGKILFERNCSTCHAPNKTLVGPPFQRIREANGLEWSISWVKSSQKLIMQKDTNALFIFYYYNKMLQTDFPTLSDGEIESIFDYVDTYPFDSTKYEHRKSTKLDRWREVDSVNKSRQEMWKLISDTSLRRGTTRKTSG